MAHGPPARKKIHNDLHHPADEEEEDEDEMPVPPDGGWGWVVVFGSFMIHVITDGMTYSFGLFYSEFLETFGEGKGYTAWIVSMLAGVTLCSGPISSSFVNRYGCRKVTIAGAILAGCCLILSVWARNVFTLIVTIGVGTGLGLGLIYLPAIVSVTTYFEKYRSLATGIAVCGSGFGTFVFAPLTEYLIGAYTWRGALMVIAGIVLNCVLFGALFRPLEAKKKKQPQQQLVAGLAETEDKFDEEPVQTNGKISSRRSSLIHKTAQSSAMVRSQSVGHGLMKDSRHNHSHNKVHYDVEEQETVAGDGRNNNGEALRSAMSQPYLNEKGSHRSISKAGTMSRPDILYQGSLYNIPNFQSTQDIGGADTERYGSFRRIDEDAVSLKPQLTDHSDRMLVEDTSTSGGCCSAVNSFVHMMNFNLFHDPIFIMFTLSNFCTSIGFNVPYVYLGVHAENLGLSKKEASHLIAIIGIANTVGRIILGYIADKTWVNRLMVYNACLTCCGIATFFSIYATTFATLAFYSAVFGFTIGAYVGLTSVILVDLLGLEKLTNAFGLLLLFQGIASLIGPPMAGTLYDFTKSYSPGFILAGVMIAISGVVLFAIPPLQRRLERKNKAEANHNNAPQRELC